MAYDQTYRIKYTPLNPSSTGVTLQDPMRVSKLPKLTRWKGILLVTVLLSVAALFGVYILQGSSKEVINDIVVEQQTQRHPSAVSVKQEATLAESEEEFRDRIRYKHTKRRLPHCLIIGCRKAGTRALLTYLNLHPQVQVAKNEIHYFDDDEAYGYGLEWYRKKMPYSFPDQITIEKTPAYFHNYKVPQRVHKMNDSIKLLVIVRDPVERSVSDYLQIHLNKEDKGKPDPPFGAQAIDRGTGVVDATYPPLIRSMYYQYMWNWLRVFDLDQFLVISGEELVKNPQPQMEKVERFLNIEHKITPDMFYYNETRGFYCIRNNTDEKCLRESKGRPHPYVEPGVLTKLRRYFAPYNHEFYKMIKWNFGWPEE